MLHPKPTEDPMTDERMALVELLQKSGDGDFLRSVAEAVLQILIEADVEGLIGAGRHERSAERLNYRNGYRDRTFDTRLGPLSAKSPRRRWWQSSRKPGSAASRPGGSMSWSRQWGSAASRRARSYLWLDAAYLKVRDGGRIVSVAAIIAVAVTTDGRREIVGLGIGPSEAEPFWSAFLKGLVKRGLKGIKFIS